MSLSLPRSCLQVSPLLEPHGGVSGVFAKRALVLLLRSLVAAYGVPIAVTRDSVDTEVVGACRRVFAKVHPDKGGSVGQSSDHSLTILGSIPAAFLDQSRFVFGSFHTFVRDRSLALDRSTPDPWVRSEGRPSGIHREWGWQTWGRREANLGHLGAIWSGFVASAT